jgi:hypothetical protein
LHLRTRCNKAPCLKRKSSIGSVLLASLCASSAVVYGVGLAKLIQ